MSSTLGILGIGFILLWGITFGLMALFSGFKYAKDIFTPTRKSVLVSGMYLTLASFSCLCPSLYFLFEPLWVEGTVFNQSRVFGTAIVMGMFLSPIVAYAGLGYFYALSCEKK